MPTRSPGAQRERWISQLAAIADEPARRNYLHGNPKLLTAEAVRRLHQEVAGLARVDLRRAEHLARAAAAIAEQLDDAAARALGCRALGQAMFFTGQYLEALIQYQTAMELYEGLGQEIEIGHTISGPGLQALIYLGDYDRAFSYAERARQIFQKHGDRLRLARLDSSMGEVLHRQDRFAEALERYRDAYQIFRELGEEQDMAASLRRMAVCQVNLNRFEDALHTYEEAREYAARQELPLLAAEADYDIAYLYFLRGEYTRAIELYEATRELCTRVGDPYRKALCDLDQSEICLELNLLERGEQMAESARAAFQHLGMGYEAAKALTFLGVAASRQGKPARALELFDKARKLFLAQQNRFWPSLLDLYKALVLCGQERRTEARRLAEGALAVFVQLALPAKAALCELVLARLDLGDRRPVAALTRCLSALARLEPAEVPAIACQAFFVLGQVHEACGNLPAAHDAYRQAHARMEDLRSHLHGEESKIAFLQDKLAVYENLVRTTLELMPGREGAAAALEYIEHAKSRSLADLIAFRASALQPRCPDPAGLAEKSRGLRERLHWTYRGIELEQAHPGPESTQRLERLRRQTRELEGELARAFSELRNSDREFVELQNAGALSVGAIRATLPHDAVLLDYYQARDLIYVCLLDRERLEVLPLAPASQVRSHFRLLQFQLSKFRLGAEYARAYAASLLQAADAHLRDLYIDLIAPIRHHLRTRHLIIVPHGFLHHLPFHALQDGSGSLIDDFSISYAPSASVFSLCVAKQVSPESRAVVLGIPDPVAPFIGQEAQGVAAALPNAELFLGEEATEEVLRRRAPGSRIVHIATHGLFRRDNPMFSALRLGKSHLNLFDLYQLRLSAELVTLSGCGTGLNVVVGGDELLGLVRGLLYAGAQAVLASLWDVYDETTAQFMKCFYSHLAASGDKAAALRTAMRELKGRFPHPYYWAPFVLTGKFR